jgi:hypothetical protein
MPTLRERLASARTAGTVPAVPAEADQRQAHRARPDPLASCAKRSTGRWWRPSARSRTTPSCRPGSSTRRCMSCCGGRWRRRSRPWPGVHEASTSTGR